MTQLSFFDESEGLHFPENLLEYYPHFLDAAERERLLAHLIATTSWHQSSLTIKDKTIPTPRLTAWYGDEGQSYILSGKRLLPLPWTDTLLTLRAQIAQFTHLTFNTVLLNYYRDGNDSVAWHSDDERELGKRPTIASLSLGQQRRFEFRHKEQHRQKYSLPLDNGSLLIMKGDLQEYWEHRIPKSDVPMGPRINLTFRVIV